MLFAKISPKANIVSQTTPFAFDVQEAEYMSAVANQYIPNSPSTTFNVIFGKFSEPAPPDEPQPPLFVKMYSFSLVLTEEQLSTWGTNDDSLLEIVADVIGTQIVEFINVPEIVTL